MINYSVRPPARVGALVALAVTVVAVILFWSAGGGGQSASAVINASVSLDAVSDGANTATSVGTIDSCRALAVGETAVLDLVIEDVSGLAGFEVDFLYDPAIVRVVTLTSTIEVDYNFLLASTLTSVIELGDALPDAGSGTFKLAAAQFPSSPVSGSGVLVRFKIEVVGSGSTDIALTNVKLSDGTGTPIPPSDTSNVYQGPINGATIASWPTPPGDDDCDGWSTVDEGTIGTNSDDACGFTAGGDPASGSWPPDLAESDSINIVDVLSLKPVFFTEVPPTSARYDIAPSGQINIVDVLRLKPFFGLTCS